MCVCVHVCVRACVHACVRACVRVCVCVCYDDNNNWGILQLIYVEISDNPYFYNVCMANGTIFNILI